MDRQVRDDHRRRGRLAARPVSHRRHAGAAAFRGRARRGGAEPRARSTSCSIRSAAACRQSDGWPTASPAADGFIEFPVDVARRWHRRRPSRIPPRPRCSPLTTAIACWSAATSTTSPRRSSRCKHRDLARASAPWSCSGLLGGLILSRWMLSAAGAGQPVDRTDHGRRLRPPHRHRRQRRRVRRAGPEPQRHARPDRAAAGRHAPGQRGHRPRSAHALEPHALADRGGADGRAATPTRRASCSRTPCGTPTA